MTLQKQIASLFCQTFKKAEVKKIDKDNHLDIHIPDLHERRGTHIFFNTSKSKIKIGFYCRDKDYVASLVSKHSQKIEAFSQGVRPIENPVFLTVEEAVHGAIKFVNLLLGKVQADDVNKSEEIQEDNSKGYPMIAWESDLDVSEEFIRAYAKRSQIKSTLYAYGTGINGYLPEWFEHLIDDKYFYHFAPHQIDVISKNITENKVIPVLDFVPYQFYQHTAQVWWMVPFSIWKNSIASFLFVDKKGFYAMYEHTDLGIITDMIFPWSSITELKYETSFGGDPNLVRMTLESDSMDFLSFDEFVSPHRGSYLKVIKSIYDVRKKTIEESKGSDTWYEGAGGEGFKIFKTPLHLVDEFKWISSNRPQASMSGYHKVPDYKPPKEWPADFMIALAMVSDNYFGYNNAKESQEDFNQLLANKIFEGDYRKFAEEFSKGLTVFTKFLTANAKKIDDVYENISNYFNEQIKFTSKESEFKIAGIIYEMWLFEASTTLPTNHKHDKLKPLYKLGFDGKKKQNPPFGYLQIGAKKNFSYVKKLYELFGKNNLWKAFIANLETKFQFFQIAYHLTGNFNYNSIDEETVKYIVFLNANRSPHVNLSIPATHPFGLYVAELIQHDPYLCAGLKDESIHLDFLDEKLSAEDCQKLISSVKKTTCQLKLKLDNFENEDFDSNLIIQKLQNDLPSGNEINFDLWTYKSQKLNYQDYLLELKKNDGYITALMNVFADDLLKEAEEYTFTSKRNSEEITGSQYLKRYAKWEIQVEDFKYSLKSFTGSIEYDLMNKVDGTDKETPSLTNSVTLHLENCPNKDWNGEFISSNNIDKSTLSFFESDLEGTKPLSFGLEKFHEDFYAMYFNSYSNDEQKEVGMMFFGYGELTSKDGFSAEFELELTPKGLIWDIVEPDHEYLFQYQQDWVLNEMTDEELVEHIDNIGINTGLWLDDEGMEEPTTQQEFWDTLVELNKRTGGKGEDRSS